MSLKRHMGVPPTPRVTSPSTTPSEKDAQDYLGPTTRSAAKRRTSTTESQRAKDFLYEEEESDYAPGGRRSRTRSRSPVDPHKVSQLTSGNTVSSPGAKSVDRSDGHANSAVSNGHLALPKPIIPVGWSWRDFSRSPSPLGLIPVHRHWRTFVHKHEVPRKALHVSIGFFVVWLYTTGTRTSAVPPYLMAALIPIATVDWLRHKHDAVNRLYVKLLGALMRESEYAGWNGVVFYLLGAWVVLYFFPKDVAVMGVLLLSWCDTAASTFGRLWGQLTPRIRRGKSLAGSLAALAVGVATSCFFYAWLVPAFGPMPGDEEFMFKGSLCLPSRVTDVLGIPKHVATVSGPIALGIVSLWSGLVASVSEVLDIFGWDDNLTIPVLSGVGIWGFLKLFA